MKSIKKPFTLLEIISALTIIIILVGMMLGTSSIVNRLAKKSRCIAHIQAIEVIIEQYKNEWGFYPVSWDTNSDGQPDAIPLDALWWSSIKTTTKDLIDNTVIGFETDSTYTYVDVYGNPFYYQSSTTVTPNPLMNPEKFDLWSMGLDGKHGDNGTVISDARTIIALESDDITNWKKN